jgi:hypothetical protein
LINQSAIRLFAVLAAVAFGSGAVGARTVDGATIRSAGVETKAQSAPTAPTALTGAAIPISPQSATVQGTVNAGGAETTVVFQYGTSTSFEFTSASQSAGPEAAPEAVSTTLSNLSFGTLYHYRILASNAFGQATGEAGTFRSPDAILSGRYAVALKVLRGGAPFGQQAGQTVHRLYNFTDHCQQGLCQSVSLRRGGASGTFTSTLSFHQGDLYEGTERSRGYCNDGEQFQSIAAIFVQPTSLLGSRAAQIAGRFRTRISGCIHGTEVAEIVGGLPGGE